MKIQSLSVVVPNITCINNCAFCVSRMKSNRFKNQMDDNLPFFDLYLKDYLKRLEFARNNGCNTIMLTGNSEPQQNRKFLTYFGMFMSMMRNPFEWIEMQTTGVCLNTNYLRFLRNHVGINLISLSISSFSDEINRQIIKYPYNCHLYTQKLAEDILKYDFSLRLSINMSNYFDKYQDTPEEFFLFCRDVYKANQVTIRILYDDGGDSEQSIWIRENKANNDTINAINNFVKTNGTPISRLSYGSIKYSLMDMSIVIDDDCMAKNKTKKIEEDENYKYLILQPNCKLYSQWDDPASLIF